MKPEPCPPDFPVSVAFAVGVVAGLPGHRVAAQAKRAIEGRNLAIASAVLTSPDLDYVPAWVRPVVENALREIEKLD